MTLLSNTALPGDLEYEKRAQLLGHLLRCPDLFKSVADRVATDGVFRGYMFFQIVWSFAENYWMQYRMEPIYNILRVQARQVLTDTDDPSFEQVDAFLRYWYALSTDQFNAQYASDVYKELQTVAVRQRLQQALDTGDNGTLLDGLTQASSDLQTKPLSRAQWRNAFIGDPNQYIGDDFQRFPLGIDWLDASMGGGIRPGEAALFIMPSKGGKTTLVQQGNNACVIRKENVITISTEQALFGDISIRQYVLATDSTRSVWAAGKIERTPPEIQERWARAAGLWAEHHRFYDHLTDPNASISTIDELFQPVRDCIAEGWIPRVLFLDWWGALRLKLLASISGMRHSDERRGTQQNWLLQIKHNLVKYGLRGYIMHQLSGAMSGRSANHMATVFDAQEDKNLINMFDYGFVSSKKDSEGRVKMVLDAARSAANPKIDLVLDGERCKFTANSPEYDAELEDYLPSADGKAKYTVTGHTMQNPDILDWGN